MRRYTPGILMIFFGLLLAACSSGTTDPAAPSPTPSPSASPSPSTPIPTGMQTTGHADGTTTVVTTFSDGSKTEVRTFKGSRVAKVTRATSPDGVRTVRITNRADNSETVIDDPTWVEKALDSTGDALATAARKTASAAKTAGSATAEGAKTVADKTAEGAKAVGRGIKKAVKPDEKKDN